MELSVQGRVFSRDQVKYLLFPGQELEAGLQMTSALDIETVEVVSEISLLFQNYIKLQVAVAMLYKFVIMLCFITC